MKYELLGNRDSLHIQVYNQLKDNILTGKLKPGESLNEQNIAKEMAISKSPVREALRELVQEGLVVHHPRKSITVIDFTIKDIEEIIGLRAVIEEYAVSLCVSRLDAEDKKSLSSIVNQIYTTTQARDSSKSTHLDLSLHEYLIQKTDHTRLIRTWKLLQSQTRVLLQMIADLKVYADYSADAHRELLERLFSGNTRTAKAAMKNHILAAGKNILKHFN
ncbi:MAG: GntR family transcriptional regulator [Planctomycetes bacterium]|nr:GntR family transcriptional regulator [Planctomycetota bacterium]